MGKATIVSGGTDGLYTVKLDYGKAQKDAAIARINARLVKLTTEISEATTKLSTQQAVEVTQRAKVEQAISAFVTASKTIPRNEANVSKALEAHGKEAAKLIEEKGKTGPLRLALQILKDEDAGLRKELKRWQDLSVEEVRSAWCADLTEDATGQVATIDVPGESKAILIAPSAPVPAAKDGQLVAREVQAAAQVFWNAAVLPGWQRHMPTSRFGVITAMNPDDTADVDLDEAKSSATGGKSSGLDINKLTALSSVPIKYMDCDAAVFAAGDHVVVLFEDGDWTKPKIVGFASNPKACPTGGFVFRPQNSVNTDSTQLTYWGEPFDSANAPLGTPMGAKPFMSLSPKMTKIGGVKVPTDTYKQRRGLSGEKCGQVDWQGPNPDTDVISWDAASIDGLVYGNSFIPDTYMNQWGIQSYGYYGDDPDKSTMLVLRKRNQGTTNAVYSRFNVIKYFDPGEVVDGAGFTQASGGKRYLIVALRSGWTAGVSFTFVKVLVELGKMTGSDGKTVSVYRATGSEPDVVLGTYTPPALMTNLHGWYFNQSGTKARCIMMGKDDQFAVEATFSGSGVTVADVPGSHMSASPADWFIKRDYSSVVTGSGSTRSLATSGVGVMRSPAFMADFQGDDGVMMQFEMTVTEQPTFSSTYAFTDTEAPGVPGVKHETYTSSGNGGWIAKDLLVIKTLSSGDSETRISMGGQAAAGSVGSSSTSQEKTLTRSAGGFTDHSITTQTRSATGGAYSSSTYRSLIDADIRSGAFVFYEVAGNTAPSSYSSSMTYELQMKLGSVDPDILQDEMTTTSSGTSVASRITTTTPTQSISTSWPDEITPGGTTSGPTSQMFWDLASPIFGGGDSQVTQGWTCYTVNEWHQYFARSTSFQSINGMIRTYYGMTLSTTLVGAGMNPIPSWYEPQPPKGVSHLVGGTTSDAAAIAQIETQPMPWLARLGVY